MSSFSSTKENKEASKNSKDALPENFSLTKDKHSQNDQTLSENEQEYSSVSSTTNVILIIVQNLDGTYFTLSVTPSDSVINVKKMIKAKKGIDAFKYYLVLNGNELEDEKSVSDYGIEHESFIRMLPFISNNVQFPVLNNSGKTIWMKFNENESIKNLKFKIQEECGIPLDKQCFTCFDERTTSNKNCGLEEVGNAIKEVRNDLAEIKCDLENEFGGTNVYNQDNVFDGHENYQRSENETPADLDSENAATSDKEYDSSANDKDLIGENKESDINGSVTGEDENAVNDQDNGFDDHEIYHGDEDETPADNTVLISDEEDDVPNMIDERGPRENENDVIITFHQSNEPPIIEALINISRNYQIVYKYIGDKLQKYLYLFNSVYRDSYYEYKYSPRDFEYFCDGCDTINRANSKSITRVSAKEIGNAQIELLGPPHCCQKKEYNIVKKPLFKRLSKYVWGREAEHIRIFTSDDKSRYYDLIWNDREKLFRCRPCISNHNEYVTAILIFLDDESGEECLQLKILSSLCNVQN